MESVLIGFSASNSYTSKIIRWFTKSHCSHAYLKFFDPLINEELILEANEHGYVLIPLSRWIKNNTIISEFKITSIPEIAQIQGLHFAVNYLGASYDALGAIALFFRRWFSRYHNPLAKTDDRVFCSEMVAMYLKYVGLLNPDEQCASYTPGDLLNFCFNSSHLKHI